MSEIENIAKTYCLTFRIEPAHTKWLEKAHVSLHSTKAFSRHRVFALLMYYVKLKGLKRSLSGKKRPQRVVALEKKPQREICAVEVTMETVRVSD